MSVIKSDHTDVENPHCEETYNIQGNEHAGNHVAQASLVTTPSDAPYVLTHHQTPAQAPVSYLQHQPPAHCYPSLSLYPSGPPAVPTSTGFHPNNRCVSTIINTASGVIIRTPHIPVYYLQQQHHHQQQQQHHQLQNSLFFQQQQQQHHLQQQKYLQEEDRTGIVFHDHAADNHLVQHVQQENDSSRREQHHEEATIFVPQQHLQQLPTLSQQHSEVHLQTQEELTQRQTLCGATVNLNDQTCLNNGNASNYALNVDLEDCDGESTRDGSDPCDEPCNVDNKNDREFPVTGCSFPDNVDACKAPSSEINEAVKNSNISEYNTAQKITLVDKESKALLNFNCFVCTAIVSTCVSSFERRSYAKFDAPSVPKVVDSNIYSSADEVKYVSIQPIVSKQENSNSSVNQSGVLERKPCTSKTNLAFSDHISSSSIDGKRGVLKGIDLNTATFINSKTQPSNLLAIILASEIPEDIKKDGGLDVRIDEEPQFKSKIRNDRLLLDSVNKISCADSREFQDGNAEKPSVCNAEVNTNKKELDSEIVASDNNTDKDGNPCIERRVTTQDESCSQIVCSCCWQLLDRIDSLEQQLSSTKSTLVQKYVSANGIRARKEDHIKENLHPNENHENRFVSLEKTRNSFNSKRKRKAEENKRGSSVKQGRLFPENEHHSSEEQLRDNRISKGETNTSTNHPTRQRRDACNTGLASDSEEFSEPSQHDDQIKEEEDLDDPDFPKKAKLYAGRKRKKANKRDDAPNAEVDALLEYIGSRRCAAVRGNGARRRKRSKRTEPATGDPMKSPRALTAQDTPNTQRCPQCSQLVASAVFPRHLHRHKLVPCPLCTACYTAPELKIHLMRSHLSERVFPCPECESSFSAYKSYRLHYLHQHVGVAPSRPVVCKLCRTEFSNASAARRHVQTLHIKTNAYSCGKCGETFSQKGNLENHIRRIHQKESKNCVCEVCDKKFAFPCDVREHLEKVHLNYRKKSAVCDVCGKSFADLRAVKTHINSVHTKDIEYPCPYCKIVFHSRTNMTSHKRRMHEAASRKYKCDVCMKGFCNPSSLRSHKQIVHEKLSRYSCDICQQSFKVQSQLKYHRRKHTGECPYQCPHCYKSFPGPSHISSHVKKVHKTIYIGVNQKRKLRLPENAPPPPPGILISRGEHQVSNMMRDADNSDVEVAIDVGFSGEMNSENCEEERASDMRIVPANVVSDQTNLLNLSNTGVIDGSLHDTRTEPAVQPLHQSDTEVINALHHARTDPVTNPVPNLHNHHQQLILYHQTHQHQHQHYHLHLPHQHLQQNLHLPHQVTHGESHEPSSAMNHVPHYIIQPNQISAMVVGGSDGIGAVVNSASGGGISNDNGSNNSGINSGSATGAGTSSSNICTEGEYPTPHYPHLQGQQSVQPMQTMPMVVRVVHDMQYGNA